MKSAMKWWHILAVMLIYSNTTITISEQQVFFTLGSGPSMRTITTNNTEILITDIGEDATGPVDLPTLACNTDLAECCRAGDHPGDGGLGQWTYPNGRVLLNNAASIDAGEQFYSLRNGPQLIRLARRQVHHPLSPTGSYCCTIPTTRGDITFCIYLVVCPPLTLENGMVTYNDSTRGFNTVATHTCNPGYILSTNNATRTCKTAVKDIFFVVGVWSGPALLCEVLTNAVCSDLPSLVNGGPINYNKGTIDNRPVSTEAIYTCSTGFILIGVPNRECQANGLWSDSAPSCNSIDCGVLSDPANGAVDTSSGTTFMNIATYTCADGYVLNGMNTRVCQSDATWSGNEPTCEIFIVSCSNLTNPTNGSVTLSSNTEGSTATYTCNTGFGMNGTENVTCGSDGNWSADPPTCELVCPGLSVNDGIVVYNTSGPLFVGTLATYICTSGFILIRGSSGRTCANGGWSGLAPTCQVDIPCGPVPSVDNGSPGTPSSTVVGGQVMYSCDPGLVHSGSLVVTCLSTGNWSTPPTCQSPPPIYLSHSSTNYLSGFPELSLSSVGKEGGLVCHTNHPEGSNWYYPNGSVVMTDGLLYVIRAGRTISLQLSSGAPPGTGGLYCCILGATNEGMDTRCILLAATKEDLPISRCDNTGAVIAAVVSLVLVVATIAVFVMYLVFRLKNGRKMSISQGVPLSDNGQSLVPTYEIVPSNYEEIPATVKVRDDCTYTQNEAYQTVSGHDDTTTPPTEGIYD